MGKDTTHYISLKLMHGTVCFGGVASWQIKGACGYVITMPVDCCKVSHDRRVVNCKTCAKTNAYKTNKNTGDVFVGHTI